MPAQGLDGFHAWDTFTYDSMAHSLFPLSTNTRTHPKLSCSCPGLSLSSVHDFFMPRSTQIVLTFYMTKPYLLVIDFSNLVSDRLAKTRQLDSDIYHCVGDIMSTSFLWSKDQHSIVTCTTVYMSDVSVIKRCLTSWQFECVTNSFRSYFKARAIRSNSSCFGPPFLLWPLCTVRLLITCIT